MFRTEDGGEQLGALQPGRRRPSSCRIPTPSSASACTRSTRDAADPDRLYLQNHWGVFRSDDGGRRWKDIGAGLPSDFGFAAAAHPHRADTFYVFPINADADRVPAGHRCRVYRTQDAGETLGAPDARAFRTATTTARCCATRLCTDDADPAGVYFGNRNGEVYASADDGDSWQQLASHLPDVLCVRAAVIG